VQTLETLTECALYNIAVAHQDKDIAIDLATKPAEKKHGADWEWWLVQGKKGLGFRVQAKRLFPNGRYKYLIGSKPNPYEQLDMLVSVSATAQLEPLYCFSISPTRKVNSVHQMCAGTVIGHRVFGAVLLRSLIM
jgi:hypothetical protein